MKGSIWIVVATLMIVCAAVLLLPVVLVEPDDYDWYSAMISFSRGHLVSSEEEVQGIHEKIAERFSPREQEFPMRELHFPVFRTEKGFVHERSPGYYGLLGLLYLFGLDRYTNIFLGVVCILFFFHLVRRYADERIALYASLLMILNPTFLTGLYRVYMSDFSYFVFGLLGMGAYWIAREKGKALVYALAGFLLSVSVIFRITNVIFFVSIALYEACLLIFPKALAGHLAGAPPTKTAGTSSRISASARGQALARPERQPAQRSVFAPRSLFPLAVGLLLGIIPLLLYNYHTMGNVFAAGYSYRFSHEGTRYFSLFGRNAIFSLRNLQYTLPVGLPRLLQGYPLVLLAPAGFFLLGRDRRRLALFMGLWFATYWALYLCYSTIREDNFQFMSRKFLPSLPALCIGGAVILDGIKGKWKYLILAVFAIFGMAITSEFMVRFVVPQPVGRPAFPGRRPPPELFGRLQDRLRNTEELLQHDVGSALRPLHETVLMLKDIATEMRRPEGKELDSASRKLHDFEEELARSVRENEPVSRERVEEMRRFLRETRRKVEGLAPPRQPKFHSRFCDFLG